MAVDSADQFVFGIAASLVFGLLFVVTAIGVVKVANYAELEPELLSTAAEFNGRTADASLEVLQDGQRSVLCFDFTQPEVPAGEHAASRNASDGEEPVVASICVRD